MRQKWTKRIIAGVVIFHLMWSSGLHAMAQAESAPQQIDPAAAPAGEPVETSPQAPAAEPSQTPAEPQEPGTQPPATGGAVPIALHLENADLLQVIGIIAAELGMNYVVDPQVSGTVNINTMGELRREDLFPLLQMVLRINGATAVQTGSFFRIVPLREVQRLPLEPQTDPSPARLPDDDRMVMNIIPLRYFSAADMTRILTPFLSEGGHLYSHEQGNILILTDNSRSIKRLLELVALFDTEVFIGQRARLYTVKNSQASRIAEELGEVFSAYAMSENSSAVRFVPIDRINSVLAVAANPGVFPEVEKWMETLDQPFREAGVRTFIYKVENGKAEDLASVLAQIHGSPAYPQFAQSVEGVAPGSAAAGLPRMQGMGLPATGYPGTQPVGLPTAGLTGMAAFAPQDSHLRIVPDRINNQLVIQATAQEYEQMRQTLRDLDIVPRQVMIEAKVYEVELTGALSVGVSAFLQNRTNAERKPLGDFSAVGGGAPSLSAQVGTLIGKTRELLLFLNAAQDRRQARLISAPSILASDNIAATINVGTEIPILTSQALVSGAQVEGSSLFTNTIQNRDTGVLLTINPRINSSGLVNLEIQQEVSVPLPPSAGSAIQSPSIQKRSIQTQVVVQDGETIAIGGIIQETRTLARNRIPLLGDIPYLGVIFGNTSYSTQKTELIILLTPTVVRNFAEAQQATAELRDKLRDLRKIIADEERKAEEERQQDEEREQNEGN